MLEVHVKELTVLVRFVLMRGRRGWSLRYIEKNIVEFKAGRMYSPEEIEEELSKHYRFLKRRIAEPVEEESRVLHLFGTEHKLEIKPSEEESLLLMGDTFILYTDDTAKNQGIVNRFYYECLKDYINEVMEEAKAALKITFPVTVQYKDVKTYFGECFHKRRLVIFSVRLAKYPKDLIRGVVYHELAHFYYQNHQEGFYRLLESVFPGYRKSQAELRKIKYRDMY